MEATTKETATNQASESKFLATPISSNFPIGTVISYAGKADGANSQALASAGWLLCDGAEIDRTKYKSLFGVIGDIHGRGNATTTFNLPDYRGRFLRGVDNGRGRDPDAARRSAAAPGGLTGDTVGSIQGDEVRAHDHGTTHMIFDDTHDGVDSALKHSYEHHNEPRRTEPWGGSETRPINAYVHWLILAGKAV